MTPELPDSLFENAPAWPLSKLYHEHSKLSPRRDAAFQEQIAAFSEDEAALRESADAFKAYPTRTPIPLPRASGGWFRGRKLRDILGSRRSQRGPFGPGIVTVAQLGGMLESACGITGRVRHPEFSDLEQDLRAQPSGGGMYPIEIYPLALRVQDLDRGVFHYQPRTHALATLDPLPAIERLQSIIFAPGQWENAAVLFILTAIFARTQIKYGERGYRIALLDAGHLAQNLLLCAADAGLHAAPLGGFHDDELAALLGIDVAEEAPIHALIVGP